ncbi:MAG: 2'-5' RNA ligase family protein, partial [Patescibacteria group bacterium]
TIVPPFQVPGFSTKASVLNQAGSLLEARIKIQGYSSFQNQKENVACLKIFSPDLEELLRVLKEDLSQLREPLERKKIVFHISIARGIPNPELERVMTELQTEPFQETFILDKLTIYQREIGKSWYEIL